MHYFFCKNMIPEMIAPIPSTQHQNPDSIPQPMSRPTPKVISPTPRKILYRHIKTPPAQFYAGGMIPLTIGFDTSLQRFI